MGWGYNIALYGYGDKWRFHRKICQQNFRPEAARRYQPLQMKMVHTMLRNLLDSPANFDDHNKMLSISLPMMTMYGYEVKSFEDPCIVAADQSITLGARLLMPGATLVNVFPRLTDEMEAIPMEFVKKQVAEGTALPSLVSDFLYKKNSVGASKEEEEAIKNVASTVYGGELGKLTISATGTFFYVMAINPDVQRKAQAEIDSVTGAKRLPELEDRPFLPYIEAIYREVMRFRPPLQLGVPHNVSKDDHYRGYIIPKGVVLAYFPRLC
ncbi:hypothetical protein GALMADRAFT_58980 [Galerina marginata CBS 339.88]|uniref:Cytochrome P450 n=1 Tax=Galerina marginata (strain CBS 339.88) TaxID=685588 RepID=A0A067TG71_GALM3|nr:hypothetical protein GALMADRAFT_58980 [Galerina marginata CBS 339.88]